VEHPLNPHFDWIQLPYCPKDGRASDDRKIVMALSLVAIVILAFHEEIKRLA
jgi:hypothetical protein